MHRSAFAAAIPSMLTQSFCKHLVRCSAFGNTMAVAAVRTGNVIGLAQCFAHTHSDRFLADVKMGEARNLGAEIELVDLFLEEPDFDHLAIETQPPLIAGGGLWRRSFLLGVLSHGAFPLAARVLEYCNIGLCENPSLHHSIHSVFIPAIRANASNKIAKSFSAKPMARVVVSISLVIAVVGSGTSSWRPISNASNKSFCIMLTSKIASSGIFNTNGPRYFTIDEAITLLRSTSTAVSRAMPLFSASSKPSLNASICTARLKLVAIFIDAAKPWLPT